MVDIRRVYTSNWLKATDLQMGRVYTMHIAQAEVGEFEDQKTQEKGARIELSFYNTKKKLGLSAINANRLAELFGTETDQWIGQRVGLQLEWQQVYGEQKQVVRICPVAQVPATGYQTQAAPAQPAPAAPAPTAPAPAPAAPAPGPAPAAGFDDTFGAGPEAYGGAPNGSGSVTLPADDFDDDIPF